MGKGKPAGEGERLRHLIAVLEAIRGVNQLITRETDRGRLLSQATARLVSAKGYSSAWLILLPPQEGDPPQAYASGPAAGLEWFLAEVRAGRLPRCVATALDREGPMLVAEPARACPGCLLASGTEGKACLVARLRYEGREFGALGVLLPREFAGDEEERTLLAEVAGDLAHALHALELGEERSWLESRLAEVAELAQRLTTVHDQEEVARLVVQAAHDMLDLRTCGLWLLDRDRAELIRIAHTRGPAGRRLPLSGKGIIPAAVRSGEAIYVPDTEQDPRYLRGQLSGRSEYCVPLVFQGETLGALNAEKEERDGFSPVERTLMDTLAKGAAMALANARLFAEMEELKEFNRRIVTSMAEGLALDDADGTILYVNPAFAQLVGRKPEEVVGRHWTEFVPPDQRRVVEAALAKRRRGEANRYRLELLRADGTRVPVLVSGSPRMEKGEFVGTQGIFTDITPLVETEERLRQALERSQRLLRGAVAAAVRIVEKRDPYVIGHSQRVAKLACAIAELLGMPRERIQSLYLAAMLHDIGKIAVPAEVLAKPGKLTSLERAMVREHPRTAVDILADIDFPGPVREAILQHHERLDGSGYPQGLRDGDIVLEARILTVADVVEAMAHHRPYRPALGLEAALEELAQGRGILYDPDVVDACQRLFGERGFTWD